MTTTEVTAYHEYAMPQRSAYAELLAGAADLIPSGLWARGNGVLPAPSPGKIFLALETGDMLGLHPIAAIQGIHVIDGKATMSAALMQAVVRSKGHRLRVKVTGTVEAGDLKATAYLLRADDAEFEYEATWTPQRAVRATLVDSYERNASGQFEVKAVSRDGKPLAWQKSLEALLKARAISEVCREGAEDALLGVHYTPEELGAQVTDAGDYIEGQAADVSSLPAEPAKPTRKRATKGTQGTRKPQAPAEAAEPSPEPESSPEPPEAVHGAPTAAERILAAESPDLPPRDGDLEGTEPNEVEHDPQKGEVVESNVDPIAIIQASQSPENQARLDAERDERLARLREAESHMRDNEPAPLVGDSSTPDPEREPWAEPTEDGELFGEDETPTPPYDATASDADRLDWINDYATGNDEAKAFWLEMQNATPPRLTTEMKAALIKAKARIAARREAIANVVSS